MTDRLAEIAKISGVNPFLVRHWFRDLVTWLNETPGNRLRVNAVGTFEARMSKRRNRVLADGRIRSYPPVPEVILRKKSREHDIEILTSEYMLVFSWQLLGNSFPTTDETISFEISEGGSGAVQFNLPGNEWVLTMFATDGDDRYLVRLTRVFNSVVNGGGVAERVVVDVNFTRTASGQLRCEPVITRNDNNRITDQGLTPQHQVFTTGGEPLATQVPPDLVAQGIANVIGAQILRRSTS